MKNKILITLIFILTSSIPVYAEETILQEENKTSIVYLKDGSYYIGKIVSKDFDGINILSDNKKLFISIYKIDYISENLDDKNPEILKLEKEKSKLEKTERDVTNIIQLQSDIDKTKQKIENLKTVKKAVWFNNPNYTRYFFAPTAMQLKKGDGYIQDIDLFVGAANYGITDNISIGGIGSLFPGVSTDQQIIAVTPKAGFDITPDIHLGGGLMYVAGAGVAQIGVGYGIGTYGNADSNLTLGIGGAYGNIGKSGFFPKTNNQNIVTGSSFVTMVGGMHRIFENASLVSENWVMTNSNSKDFSYLFSYGLRFFWEKVSFDCAILYPIIPQTTTYPLPYFDVVWHF